MAGSTDTMLTVGQRSLLTRVLGLIELLPAALDARMGDATGLNLYEVIVLRTLADADDHRLRLTVLASRTNGALPRLSRVISRLADRGLVTRAACALDGRATNAVLTAEGLDLLARVEPAADEVLAATILGPIGDEDAEGFAEVVLRILKEIDPDSRFLVSGCAPRRQAGVSRR